MARKRTDPADPAPKSLPAPAPPPGDKGLADARALHGFAMPGAVYASAVAPLLGDKVDPTASKYALDVIARMAPRDAAEEMLVSQLLFAHARVMRLTELANRQTSLETIRVVHEYADRASNTYRRLMLTLAEYRRPPRTGDTFAVVKQTNIAGQQVIQNHEKSTGNATNEQGFQPAPADGGNSRPPAPALPADTGRLEFTPFVCPARETVEAVHRPADVRRQSPLTNERDAAR